MAQRSETLHSAVTSTGSGGVIIVKGKSGVMLQVIGASLSNLKIVPQGSIYGDDWDGLSCINMSTLAIINAATGITASGMYWVPTPNVRTFRANISSLDSGTVTVYAGVGDAAGPPNA